MEKYYRDDNLTPKKPYDPLEKGKMKHCDMFDKCIDCCKECLFNNLYKLNPKEWEAPNQWNGLVDNEY